MKALTSSETPKHKLGRRMSKRLMERRRRERINHSLETLRLLMLENRHSEKLNNPKVEKAEILESVVEFLQAEKEMGKGQEGPKRALQASSGQTPACTRQNSYQEGIRSCLLKVGCFIANKSRELDEPAGATTSSFALPEPRTRPAASPGRVHPPLGSSPAAHAGAPAPQHELRRQADLHCDTRKLLSPAAVSAHSSDPVWRPWPQ
ncbi:hairy-related 5 [Cololabis saira]|uniref:hairy-related 5 n=1 Tax=Cololabis saira TaxID=129043 RepID=UPI002AD49B88|nr:hairy-related 5 [Cololabis saira]